MTKSGPTQDRIKNGLAHPAYNFLKWDSVFHLYAHFFQVGLIGVISLFHLHGCGPRWRRLPAMSYQRNIADLLTDRLQCPEDAIHATPTEFAVPQIYHAVLLIAAVERHFPRRVIGIEEEGNDVGAQWAQGRLADFVTQAVADVDPTATCFCTFVIVIPVDTDRVVVVPIAIENDASIPRHLAHETHQVKVIALPQSRRPFKDKDDSVSGLNVQ